MLPQCVAFWFFVAGLVAFVLLVLNKQLTPSLG